LPQELLERAGPRTEKTAPDGYQQRGPYVVAPEEIFDGSMKDGDVLSVDLSKSMGWRSGHIVL